MMSSAIRRTSWSLVRIASTKVEVEVEEGEELEERVCDVIWLASFGIENIGAASGAIAEEAVLLRVLPQGLGDVNRFLFQVVYMDARIAAVLMDALRSPLDGQDAEFLLGLHKRQLDVLGPEQAEEDAGDHVLQGDVERGGTDLRFEYDVQDPPLEVVAADPMLCLDDVIHPLGHLFTGLLVRPSLLAVEAVFPPQVDHLQRGRASTLTGVWGDPSEAETQILVPDVDGQDEHVRF